MRLWEEFRAGSISHFTALKEIYALSAPGETALLGLTDEMGLEPELAHWVGRLREANWDVIVVSAGCQWYIDRLLRGAGVSLKVHANPGRVVEGRLLLEWPEHSPFQSDDTGIDKPGVVRDSLKRVAIVAFAGDGIPDLPAALLVPAELRFARNDLATALRQRGEAFHPFERWSEIARHLLEST